MEKLISETDVSKLEGREEEIPKSSPEDVNTKYGQAITESNITKLEGMENNISKSDVSKFEGIEKDIPESG